MSIRAIRNQPFQFGSNIRPRSLGMGCDCGETAMPSYITLDDEIWAQATLTLCADEEDKIFHGYTDNWSGFNEIGAWTFFEGNWNLQGYNPGSTLSNDFIPVVGKRYILTITGFTLGTLQVDMGGASYTITASTEANVYTFEFTASITQQMYITATDNGGANISDIYLVEANTNVTAIFHQDGETDIVINQGDAPGYFIFYDGGFTFQIPMEDTGLASGCFTLELRDNCSDTGIISQQFSIIENDCDTLLIRACNDYANMGFGIPFAPRIRIPARMGWPSYNSTVEEERYSDGVIMRPTGDRTSSLTIKTGILNEYDHAFLSSLPLWDHVYVGEGDLAREVVVQEGKYEPLYGDDQWLNGAVTFDVSPKAELVRKTLCGPALEGCSPANDPICLDAQMVFSFTNAGDGLSNFNATLLSDLNFPPGTATVQLSGGAPVAQTFGTLPDTLTWGPFSEGASITFRLQNSMNPNCVMTKFFDVPPTVFCGVPDLEYNFIDNGDSTFDLEITMNTTEGFTPGDIYVEQGGVTAGEQAFGALPDTLTFVNLNNSQAVIVHFVNLVEGCTPYVEDIGVPEEPELLCEGDETASFTVQSGGTAYLYMGTGTGSFTARNDYGDLYIGPPEEGQLELPPGQYCVYPSDDEGTKSGTVSEFAVSGDVVDLVTERLISTIQYQYLGLPVITSMPAVASTNTALIYYVISYGTLLTSVPPMGDYEDLEDYQVNNCPLITSIPSMNPAAHVSLVFTGDSALATFGVLPIIKSITISGSNITDPDVVDAIINALNPPEGTSGYCTIGSLLSLRTSASDTNYNACVSAGWHFA
jgi:hypothetical protein